MSKNLTGLLCVSAALLLSACASAPNYPAPPKAGSIEVGEAPLAVDQLFASTARIGETQVYLSQTKGGSLGLGLLGAVTGGLGTLAAGAVNGNLVAQKSQEMAASLSKIEGIDVQSRIKLKVAERAPELLSKAQPAYAVAGALLLSVDTEDMVRSALVINARNTSAPDAWAKSYFYHFAPVVNVKSLEGGGHADLFQSIGRELEHAIDATSGVLVDDLSGKLTAGTPVKVRSDFLKIFGNTVIPHQSLQIAQQGELTIFRIDGKPAMILFPHIDGIHLFQPGQFTVEK